MVNKWMMAALLAAMTISSGGLLRGDIIILDGNGQLILNGQAQPLPPNIVIQFGDPDRVLPALSIVNDGFANDQDVPGSLEPLIKSLRSQSFTDRDAATQALLRLPPRRLNDIVTALSTEADSEAIARLTQVAAHLFLKPRTQLKTQTSLLGVWFKRPNPLATNSFVGMKFKFESQKIRPTDADTTNTVVVTELQPGFPAMQTLLNGDRIVTLDGKGFPEEVPGGEILTFQSRVAALWPREIVPVTIFRDGKLLDITLQLAGMPRNGPVTTNDIMEARTNELTAFLNTLKTGDKPQAVAPVR